MCSDYHFPFKTKANPQFSIKESFYNGYFHTSCENCIWNSILKHSDGDLLNLCIPSNISLLVSPRKATIISEIAHYVRYG